MELFHNITPAFEKTAGRYPVSKDRDMMFSEIMGFLYKEAPYLAEYTVSLDIKGQDETSGYIYGAMKVSPKAIVGPQMSQNGLVRTFTEPSEKVVVSIPVIVDNSKLFPFDVFIDSQGKFQPLTARRLKVALQQPSPYAVAKAPANTSAYGPAFSDMNNAPTRAHGPAAVGPNAVVKTSSVLTKVAAGLTKAACDAYLETAESDAWVRSQIVENDEFARSLGKLVKTAEATAADGWDTEVVSALLEKIAGGYRVTAVSAGPGYTKKTATLTNAEASALPAKVRNEAVKVGQALLTSEANEGLSKVKETPTLEAIEQSGIYAVVEKTGKIKKAAVIADVRTLSGRKTALKYAVSPSGGCTQEKIAGVWAGDLIDFEKVAGVDPTGDSFLLVGETVYGPVRVHNRVTDADGVSRYAYSTDLGTSGTLKTASVLRPSAMGEGNYLIPNTTKFLPANWRGGLLSDATRIEKLASKRDLVSEVRIIRDGSRFTFSGGSGISKLAHEDRTELRTGDALLLLGSLGSTAKQAKDTLLEVHKLGEARVLPSRKLTPSREATKIAYDEKSLAIITGIRADLLKEAAALTDSKTVDSVLSLNFVSPENIQEYLGSRPQLGESLNQLCEMLVAARLGMSDVPEGALTSCITSLDKILQGLDALEIRSRHMMTQPQM